MPHMNDQQQKKKHLKPNHKFMIGSPINAKQKNALTTQDSNSQLPIPSKFGNST